MEYNRPYKSNFKLIRDGIDNFKPLCQTLNESFAASIKLKNLVSKASIKLKNLASKAALEQAAKDRYYRLKLTYDLIFCEHYYNATKGNPLFALEAYKIYNDNNIPTKPNDWFMEYFYSLSTKMLTILEEGHAGERASQAVYRGFCHGDKQKGRSIFTEYHKIKERADIYHNVKRLLEQGKDFDIACSAVSEKTELSFRRVENIYGDEKKIFELGLSAFIKNKRPRKV